MNMKTVTKPHTVLAHFGSLRSTLYGIALLALVLVVSLVQDVQVTLALSFALGFLALNLLTALVVHPVLRHQLPLLVSHFSLLALVVLVALGKMMALDGRFELTQGVEFDGKLIESNAGRWHRDGLARIAFRHDGFEIDYAQGRKRGATRNRVVWNDTDGTPRAAVIGDHRPLVVDGYRFYTSSNKGFAPLLSWRPLRGQAVTGAVHLPSFPVNELQQSREWSLPDGRSVWVMLQIDETLIDPNARTTFRLPSSHRLVLRTPTQRAELAPGDSFEVDGGMLVYEGLRTWMGYRVSYDWTLPWLLAASLLAAFSLAWHYTRRFFFVARPTAATRPALVTAPGEQDA
jgi:ResB-like family